MIKSLDWYGEPISMNYRGKGSFNTYFGAYMTFLTWAVMIFYIYQKIDSLSNKDNPSTTYNTGVIKNMNTEIAEKINGEEGNFKIKSTDVEFGMNFYFMNGKG